MLERDIERRMRIGVELMGGLAIKLTCPGWAGMPDRLVLWPGGKAEFVEVKAPGKKMRALQAWRARLLEGLGFKTVLINSLESLGIYLQEHTSSGGTHEI